MDMKSLKDTYVLSNGVKIPCIALGTWESLEKDAKESVESALKYGYRHIDTAAIYKNEKSVGEGIKASGIPRQEIFVTSKLWNTDQGYENTLKAFEKTMGDLGLDYLDLYLIHWPAVKIRKDCWQEANYDTWRAFEKLYKEGKIRAIGVSNFMPHHLEPLLAKCEIRPMVNQIEYHPGHMQKETVDFSQEHGMLIEAWSPLGRGEIFKSEDMKKIASKYGKTVAQVCIRWCLQNGTLPLPKSVHTERIKENAEVFDFNISEEDMKQIDGIKCQGTGLHPDTADF